MSLLHITDYRNVIFAIIYVLFMGTLFYIIVIIDI
jgi:hypothetical protein